MAAELKNGLTLALDDLLKKALMPGEEVMISINGSFGEAIAVTDKRAIIIRESTTIGAKSQDQVFPHNLADVEAVTMSASDVGGQLILEVAPHEGGRVPAVEKRMVAFPVASFDLFEKAGAEIEKMAKSARENPKEEATSAGTPAEADALACASCGAAVRRSHLFCTTCGRQLWTLCAGCGAPIDEGWRHCAMCGRDLSGEQADPRAIRRVMAIHERETAAAAREGEAPAAPSTPAEPASPTTSGAIVDDSPEQINRTGVEYYERGELEQAIAAFRRAIELSPNVGKFRTNLGVAYADEGMIDEAKAAYDAALKINPNDTSALLYLGGLWAEEEDYDRAKELWQKVLELAPNTPEAREARDNLIGLENL